MAHGAPRLLRMGLLVGALGTAACAGAKPAAGDDTGGGAPAEDSGGADSGGADSGDPIVDWRPPLDAGPPALDLDGDGWVPPDDCAPRAPSRYPGAPEIWYDGIDSDCAGDDDFDQDGDGDPIGVDCDDTDPATFPGAPERGGDGRDQDCDGEDGPPALDADGDGYDAAYDCDEADPAVYPGAPDACGDGRDTACDGDDDCPLSSAGVIDHAYATLLGEHAGDRLGQGEPGVLAIGDTDGDGSGALLLTAVFGGPAGEGRVYLVEGAAGPSSVATAAGAAWTGAAPGDQLGRGLAAPGDLDGDGLPDLVVSAPGADLSGAEAGALYLLPPGGGPLGAPFALGFAAGDELGELCGAPGLGPAGAGALLAGAQFADGGAGAVYLLVDTAGLGGAAATVRGAPGEELGSDLAVGDLDGDGLPELALGARGAGGDGRGAVYLFSGAIRGAYDSADADAQIVGEAAGDDVGWGISIALGADLDGDGYGDLVVGARGRDAAAATPDAGLVSLWRGPISPGAHGLSAAWASWRGADASDWIGDSVAMPGDIDGDGADELVIGSGYAEPPDGGRPSGAAYTLAGPLSAGAYGVEAAATGAAWAGGSRDRMRVHAAGDVNGDGRADVAVSAQLNSGAGFEAGAAYLLSED
ncbi:MAG: FG-GAP repeat protein [Deltaproteobacteria bacterium]|nr:FG-GAP repeat protein [Deltaproteobacteria bacterium]